MTAPDDTTTTTTNVACTILDVYWHPVACEQIDPCLADGSQTLWTLFECGPHNPPMSVFCADYPTHPLCILPPTPTSTTTTIEVGPPPTLPPTGSDTVAGPASVVLICAGMIAVVAATSSRRRHGG